MPTIAASISTAKIVFIRDIVYSFRNLEYRIRTSLWLTWAASPHAQTILKILPVPLRFIRKRLVIHETA